LIRFSPVFDPRLQQYRTKENLHISTYGSVFGALESIECLASESTGSCSLLPMIPNKYMNGIIGQLLVKGYTPLHNLFSAAYDWRLDPYNGLFL
jgi:hypothetical protein